MKEKKGLGKLLNSYEKGCFPKSEYLKICSSGSKPGIFYGQANVLKLVEIIVHLIVLFYQPLTHQYMV